MNKLALACKWETTTQALASAIKSLPGNAPSRAASPV